MTDPKAQPKCKRTVWLLLRVCVGLCSVLVTAGLGLLLWSLLLPRSPGANGNSQAVFLTAHDAYMAAEYPKRGAHFRSMAEALCQYVAESPIQETELFRYLGRPDEFYLTNVVVREPKEASTTNKVALFAYLFDRPGTTNKESVTAQVSEGRVYQVALYDYKHKGLRFQPFPAEAAPNQQGGANGRQPFSSETNRTSAAAASRRSP